jgi:hypothetical protein
MHYSFLELLLFCVVSFCHKSSSSSSTESNIINYIKHSCDKWYCDSLIHGVGTLASGATLLLLLFQVITSFAATGDAQINLKASDEFVSLN